MGTIAGISTNRSDRNLREKLMKMMNCQAHRDSGEPVIFVDTQLAVAMRNTQDTSLYKKYKTSEYGEYNVTQNKIYAFVDGIVLGVHALATEFESLGYHKDQISGSATVAYAYQKWGLDFMKHLEGEFACAVWDPENFRLVIARDPFGHKPVHYYCDSNVFLFSSEIKGIISGGITPELDLVSLSDFLTLNNVPFPKTIFKDIFQVPPGSLLIFSRSGMQIRTYWEPKMSIDQSMRLEDATSLLTEKLKHAIKKRMVTEDVYCFLSGGIDSSAVISFASELSAKPIHAISVGFEEEETNELEDAAVMASHVQAVHHKVIARPESFFDMLNTMVLHHDAPFTDTSSYPTYYAAKTARQLTDVILTGDGPDQTMGGSGHHVAAIQDNVFGDKNQLAIAFYTFGAAILKQMVRTPKPSILSKVERKILRESLPPVHKAFFMRSFFPDNVKQFICNPDLWKIHEINDPYRYPKSWFFEAGDIDTINKYLYSDIRFYVVDDLMIKLDRMCMAHGLETISPFQDIELGKVVGAMPGHFKINRPTKNEIITKYILKKVCEKRFPDHIMKKKKQGFGIPLEKWLKQRNGEDLKSILLDPKTMNRGYFNKKSMEHFVNIFLTNQGDYFYPNPAGVVALLTLELWHRNYIDQ
ncbi:MAG: asparagine synthase-related protein [Pseudomonadota bacterium]